MDLSASASELDMPIGLAVDFADELEFGLELSRMQGKSTVVSSPRMSSAEMSPSSSRDSTGGNRSSLAPTSPASTAYMTSPPTSPRPISFPPDTRPDSDSEPEQESQLTLGKGKSPITPSSYDIKGKSRAIPTPKLPHRELSLREFQTPPDTSFGTPSGSGLARERPHTDNTTAPTDVSTRDLPSIMPLGPSSDSFEREIDITPRPSRIRSRALSGISFSSLRDAVNSRRKSISRQPSISASGTSSPIPSLGRKLSFKGITSLVRRKKDRDGSKSRSGLNSEVTSGISTPASAFLTPSSTIVRRHGEGIARVSVVGPWENDQSASSSNDSSTPQQDDTPPADPYPKAEQEVVSRPVRGRAETAPAGDYFGFTFGFEEEEEDKQKLETEEPSQEDSSDVLIRATASASVEPPRPESGFDRLPRELHLLILGHLVGSYVGDHVRALQDGTWSVTKAGSTEDKWVGEAAGLRAIIGMSQSGRQRGHHALPHLHKEDAPSIASSQQSDINPAAKDRFQTHGRDPNGESKIWNRTGRKLVVDETNRNAQSDKELVLNFYDFVRICDSDQARFLPAKEQEIKLDLQWLRDQFLAKLDVARGKIQDVKSNDAKGREYPERFRLPRVIKTFLGDKLGIGKGKPYSKSKSLMPTS